MAHPGGLFAAADFKAMCCALRVDDSDIWDLNMLPQYGRDVFTLFESSLTDFPVGCIICTKDESDGVWHSENWSFRVKKGYLEVKPITGPRIGMNAWPAMRHTWPEYYRVHKWIGQAMEGVCNSPQTNLLREIAGGYNIAMVYCHLCGNSMCVRPAHIRKQTRLQDTLDRVYHKPNRRSQIRPTHLQ